MGTGPIIDDVARTLAALGTRRRLPAGAAAALGGLAGRSPVTTMATTRRATVRCPYDAATLTGFDIAGRHAQTFKAPATGRLAEVSVRIDHTRVPDGNFVGDYVAQIVPTDAAGAPILGTVLAQAVVPEAGLSFGDQAARFAFGAGATPSSSVAPAAGSAWWTGRWPAATPARAASCSPTPHRPGGRSAGSTAST